MFTLAQMFAWPSMFSFKMVANNIRISQYMHHDAFLVCSLEAQTTL